MSSEQVTWLIRLSAAPYYNEQLNHGLNVALACGAFGQSVVVVLEDLAVNALNPEQLAPKGEGNIFKQLTAMPLYDIETLYLLVDDDDRSPCGSKPQAIEDLNIETINVARWGELVANAKHVLSF